MKRSKRWICNSCKNAPKRHGRRRRWVWFNEKSYFAHRCYGDEVMRRGRRLLDEYNILHQQIAARLDALERERDA